MKTTGFYFTWCASLKTAGNVSGPNIVFQICFLAIAISFLDNYPNLFIYLFIYLFFNFYCFYKHNADLLT